MKTYFGIPAKKLYWFPLMLECVLFVTFIQELL